MFISDLNYLQEVEVNQVEGGFAYSTALGSALSLGVVSSLTSSVTATNTNSGLILTPIGPIPFNAASAASANSSFAS
ncbi:hypothetical protein VB715_21700 [Crocosphaera sp. UHCC 0190]|uniref:hypothetical protein n=1 Tax=Crocosphaera sp. UHCC 0190 TaxID=3110246 RepID=UPI002B21C2A2|nr:hypothetical protein [Crocosphaera sp. UHCC 0190]MEA5512390.1 hypothetical protein [Crocosphaera sp. UHCC 0190]